MSSTASSDAESDRRPLATVALFIPFAVALILPFLGALISLSVLAVAPSVGRGVWPDRPRSRAAIAAAAALALFWLGPFLSVAGVIGPLRSEWLLIPLCAPEAVGWLVPALIAIGVYSAGCVASIRRGPGWWPVAALGAIVTYELTGRAIDAVGGSWVC